MQDVNKTTVTKFVLLGFSNFHKFQNFLFCAVLLAYTICVLGNITIFLLVRSESSLHTPMYFFISTFTVLEIMFVSVTVPKLLALLIQTKKTISFLGCFTQLYALHALGETECVLLSLMVFDRYLAINNPLHYSAIMNTRFCHGLALMPWIFGFTLSLFPTVETFLLDFCGPNEIDHFFCDLAPLQNLSCSDPFVTNMITIVVAIILIALPFFAIVGFYSHIIYTVMKIKNKEGKMKAFSTCSSHLIVVSLFFVSAIIVYAKPEASHYDKFLALMYTVVTPLLNPFIYTFRNRDVKNAFRKVTRQVIM
ncbi:olfactory receptor 10A7-like [Bufo gargarizans]|uniref:olfactory receptor 10A7-like n=1 Tax=Bufo gargarizans TaxID=30331 RepID=UPI001CF2B40A|nr:olfactory receptor 10A7-like [Bufo gargarizans]